MFYHKFSEENGKKIKWCGAAAVEPTLFRKLGQRRLLI
jgi:hypothetical protein